MKTLLLFNLQKYIIRSFACFFVFLCCSSQLYSQPPTANVLYMQEGNTIYNMDQATNITTINTISTPGGAAGLAVNRNFYGVGPDPTFYTTVNDVYYYWDGTGWVNTGHTTGTNGGVNIGGSGPYIYNIDGGVAVYRYDGTGNGTFFMNLTGFNGPWDCVGDNAGNLYLLNTNAPAQLLVYDANANLVCSYNVLNCPYSPAGGGFGIVNQEVFADLWPSDHTGTVTAPLQITFSPPTTIGSFLVTAGDFASAPLQNINDSLAGNDVCVGVSSPITVYGGSGTGGWSSSDTNIAIVNDTGLVTGISPGTVVITFIDSLPSNGLGGGCFTTSTMTDTATLSITVNSLPLVTLIDSTSPQMICPGGTFTLAIAQPSSTYSYQWQRNNQDLAPPLGTGSSITSGFIGDYQLVVTTDKGCTDSSKTITIDNYVVAVDFDVQKFLGCDEDTVQIINNSAPSISQLWDFGDGSYPQDTTEEPMHIYEDQGTYQIKLIIHDFRGCVDSMIKIVEVQHPLKADFTVSEDSLCQDEMSTVQFTNKSIGAQFYQWDFDDGGALSNQANPSHNFTAYGVHNVMLIAYDTLSCYDTAYRPIYVDSTPYLFLIANKTDLCVGERLELELDYLSMTADTVLWNFGDGNSWYEFDRTEHSYDLAGTYQVTVTVDYPVCTSTHDTVLIRVHNFPLVNLGSDTTLCLQGDPIILKNLSSNGDPAVSYKWNTGDTTEILEIVHPGYYTLTATQFDCSTTEGITIDKDCYIDVPNAFTPNGDGSNDYFLPRKYLTKGVVRFKLTIFNRWGQKVFETENTKGRGWDGAFNGKPQPNGVYIYQMEVGYKNGRSEQYSGNITLIR